MIIMLILEHMNITVQYYEKHRGIIIYFESIRKEVWVMKYALLTSKQMKAHKHKRSLCNLQ
jgi:hypothetical protein